MDFERGNLLYLTGTAEVIWDGDEWFCGCRRLLRFYLSAGYRVGVVFPCWSASDFRPFSIALAPGRILLGKAN